MASGIVLTESFVIKDVDPDGKKFDKVSRIVCTSENGEFDLILDVNTDIYPMKVSDNFELALATTLELDGNLCFVGINIFLQAGKRKQKANTIPNWAPRASHRSWTSMTMSCTAVCTITRWKRVCVAFSCNIFVFVRPHCGLC